MARRRSPVVVEFGSLGSTEGMSPLAPDQLGDDGFGLPVLDPVAEPTEAPGLFSLRGAADTAIAGARGIAAGVRGFTDLAGTDNPVSEAIGEGMDWISELESPERKAERQRRAQIIKEAEASGSITREIGAYLGSFAEAPLDTLLEAVGTTAPTLLAAFLPGGQGAVAARLATTAGIGAAQGAGFTKRSIADSTEQGLLKAGASPQEAQARAVEAQSWGGPNTDQILVGSGFGAVAGRFGAEGTVARSLSKVPMVGSRFGHALAAAGGEFVTEAAQGGHEQFAGNLAQQREGLDTPLMQGVAGSSALEGVAGAGVGAGFGALTSQPATAAEEDEGTTARSRSIAEMLAQAGVSQAGAPQEPVAVTPGAALAAAGNGVPRGTPEGRPLPIRTSIEEFSEEELGRARAMADDSLAQTGEHHVVEIRGGTLAVVPASRARADTVSHYSTAGDSAPAQADSQDPAELAASNTRLLDQLTELAKDPLVLRADRIEPQGDGDAAAPTWHFGAMGRTARGKRAAALLRKAQEAGIPEAAIAMAIQRGNAATRPSSPRFDDPNAPVEPDPNALERARVRAQALADDQGGRWAVAAVGKPEDGRYEAVPMSRLRGRRPLFEVDGGKRRRPRGSTPSGRMEPGIAGGRTPIAERNRRPSLEEVEGYLRDQRRAGQSTFGAKAVRDPDGGFLVAYPDEPEFSDPAWQVDAAAAPAPAAAPLRRTRAAPSSPRTAPAPAEQGRDELELADDTGAGQPVAGLQRAAPTEDATADRPSGPEAGSAVPPAAPAATRAQASIDGAPDAAAQQEAGEGESASDERSALPKADPPRAQADRGASDDVNGDTRFSRSTQRAPRAENRSHGAQRDTAASTEVRGQGETRADAGRPPDAGGDPVPAQGERSGDRVRPTQAEADARGAGRDIGAAREPDGAYQADLFGDPVPAAPARRARPAGSARARVSGDVRPARAVRGERASDTPRPPGEYYARTFVGESAPRRLAARRIETAADAAQATTYLYRSAVERFDAILTDDAGKPLAVIGGFKGALAETAVYPTTLIGEAVRVPGATRVWFSHNHPSGSSELSAADRRLFEALKQPFEVAGIEPMGMLAIGDGRFASTGVDGEIVNERIPGARSSDTSLVPVVERELEGRQPGDPDLVITSPAAAIGAGIEFYERQRAPGVILLNAQNRVVGWMPLPDGYTGSLRGRVGHALYRAVSESNAGAALVVHGGELAPLAGGKVPAWQNVAAALQAAGTRVLDSIDVAAKRSASLTGLRIPDTVFSRALRDAPAESEASGSRADQVRSVVEDVAGSWDIADRIEVLDTFADAPAAVHAENERQAAGGASGVPAAFLHDGRIWLVADQLGSAAEVASALYHESTHFGLRGAFGSTLDPILDEVARRRRAEVQRIAKRYGLDYSNPVQRRIAAEESLAALAEVNPKAGFVVRAIAAIRDVLDRVAKRLGFELEMSDAQAIRNLIEPARQFARNGGKPGETSIRGRRFNPLRAAPGRIGFSRGAESDASTRELRRVEQAYGGRQAYDRAREAGRTKLNYRQWLQVRTPAFKQWFGDWETANRAQPVRGEAVETETPASERGASTVPDDRTRLPHPPAGVEDKFARSGAAVNGEGVSKAVDPETGEPQVLYHGTNADFTEFSASPMTGGLLFFSPEPEIASGYAMGDRAGWGGMGLAEERAILQVAAERHPKAFKDGYLQPVSRAEAVEALNDAGDIGWAIRLADQLEAGEISVAQAVEAFARERDAMRGDSSVMPVFLNVRQPAGTPAKPIAWREAERRAASGELARNGADGAYTREGDGWALAVTSPAQVKSATANQGGFDPASPDIRFQRTPAQELMQPGGPTPEGVNALGRDITARLGQLWQDSTKGGAHFKWWRGVNTQYHKATLDADFKRVFDVAQDLQKDVSRYAHRASDLAPTLLPDIASAKDVLAKSRIKEADLKKVSEAVLEGTLVDADPAKGKVWTERELRTRFGMNDKQVGLYQEYRAALVRSLDDFGRSDMLSFADEHVDPLTRRQVMEAEDLKVGHAILKRRLAAVREDADPDDRAQIDRTRERIASRVERIEALKENGYSPLMRFGRYSVLISTRGEDGKVDTHWFSLHDSLRDANRTAREMLASIRQEHPKARLLQGTMSPEEHKLYSGVTADTLQVFGEEAGFSDSAEWKALIELTKSNRSALKRMLERKRTPGFSEDLTRILAAFISSTGRATAHNLHQGELERAIAAIPKHKGTVITHASRLRDYLQNPTEEAQALRGLLFHWFLGGSVASAAVNLTQPLTMTLPYLAVKDGPTKALARILAASKAVVSGRYKPDTARALKHAELEGGVVNPQEVHMLQAEVNRNLGSSVRLRKALFAWGYFFSAAERFNRRVTFVAAYEQAKELGSLDPVADAEHAVEETQGIYGKQNRPDWARGAVFSTIWTFKQFSVAYVEFVARLLKNKETRPAGLLALGVLIMLSGLSGLPFAEDVDDIVDTVAQQAGYNFQSDRAKQEFVASLFGNQVAEFALYGMSALSGMPLEVQQRLGLGNLSPGTSMLKPAAGPSARVWESLEVFGAVGSLGRQALDAIELALKGETSRAVGAFLPVAAANVAKAIDMHITGLYRDTSGKKVMAIEPGDAFVKGLGFQPGTVGRRSRIERDVREMTNLHKHMEQDIASQLAAGIFERDEAKQKRARDRWNAWNAKNPDLPIVITRQQLKGRVESMASDRSERILRGTPREIRAAAAARLRRE